MSNLHRISLVCDLATDKDIEEIEKQEVLEGFQRKVTELSQSLDWRSEDYIDIETFDFEEVNASELLGHDIDVDTDDGPSGPGVGM